MLYIVIFLHPTTQSSGSGTTLGSSVTYTCLHGAIPTSAVMTSTCQGSQGRWSPMPEPCVFASCGDPPSVANMNVRVLTDRSLTGAFPGVTLAELATAYGGEAVYSCGEGEFARSIQQQCTPRLLNTNKLIFIAALILFLVPNPSISLYFQTDKLIFGCVDVNFGPQSHQLITLYFH